MSHINSFNVLRMLINHVTMTCIIPHTLYSVCGIDYSGEKLSKMTVSLANSLLISNGEDL